MGKSKALIFYTYLPPWRIDVFNEIGNQFELMIVFLNANSEGFTYNRELLLTQLKVNCIFWNKGIDIGSKAFRFGIYRIVKEYKPQVVFTHEYSPTSILLSIFLRLNLFPFKLVVTTSDNLKMAEGVRGLKKYFRKYVLSRSSGAVVYSEEVKSWYQNQFPELNIDVCPNIQNPESLLKHKTTFPEIAQAHRDKFKLGKKIILFVGRLEQVKGVDLLIKAFASTLKESHYLVLVGDGSQKDKLFHLSLKYKVKNKVIFAGHFDGAALYAWYSMANFFVLPSRYEPFGAVVNESLVFGCPVLASKHIGALDYISEGKNGFIFDPEDRNDFERCLLKAEEQFTTSGIERPDMMICSFQKYIKAFTSVLT